MPYQQLERRFYKKLRLPFEGKEKIIIVLPQYLLEFCYGNPSDHVKQMPC